MVCSPGWGQSRLIRWGRLRRVVCVECDGLLLNGSVASGGTLVLRFPTSGMLKAALRVPLFMRDWPCGCLPVKSSRSQRLSRRKESLSVAANIDGLMRDQRSPSYPLHRVRPVGGFIMACSVGRHDLTTVRKRQSLYGVGSQLTENVSSWLLALRPTRQKAYIEKTLCERQVTELD
ncbi:uncharacterized protein PgNI_02431 [Pyricularia grisea]|uniref:Uncharacterized protein n=1 Tax=Pyricularia grisea TaxID=148305 RepID=A0A6P8BHL4_PYRGI|nr:uncharacterized protein PgNI_02431 [Pyricularia grisea]TLD16263.1 hypothetical protein PgNI_02431 [Pyricularia grisea]